MRRPDMRSGEKIIKIGDEEWTFETMIKIFFKYIIK
jgi:hypothetical protein